MCETERSVSILDCKVRPHLWENCLLVLASNEYMNYLRAHRKWLLDLSCLAYLARRFRTPGAECIIKCTPTNMMRSSASAKVRTKSSARDSLKLPGGPDISNMWPRESPPPRILFTAR